MNNFFAGFYWSARKQTRIECARLTTEYLFAMARLDANFSNWQFKGKSRRSAVRIMEVGEDSISSVLKANNRDVDGSPIEELGLSLSVWNGSRNCPASLSILCGAYAPMVMNSVVLDLPIDWSSSELEIQKLMEVGIQTWEPEYAVLTSYEILNCAKRMPWEVKGLASYRNGKLKLDLSLL